jgi:hypothetical protein
MTISQRAIAYLKWRYTQQCEIYPRTREIPCALYVRRNVAGVVRNMVNMPRTSERVSEAWTFDD